MTILVVVRKQDFIIRLSFVLLHQVILLHFCFGHLLKESSSLTMLSVLMIHDSTLVVFPDMMFRPDPSSSLITLPQMEKKSY
jgi:hypothetical protein